MPLPETIESLVAVGLTGVLGWAATVDARERRIPNTAVLAVLALSVPWLLAGGVTLASALAAGLIALVVGYAFFHFRIMGAGDAKLFASLALFSGLSDLPLLALTTTIAGGLIAVVSLAARPTRALVILQMQGRGDTGRGIPYGVAIALAGASVVWARIAGMLPPAPL